jgi:ribosome-associated protein
VPPKPRKKTKPTRASRERRLETKTRQQRTKGLRGKVKWDS